MSSKSKILTALDLGSASIRMAAAEITPRGDAILRAMASAPSQGLRKGVVINIELAVEGIHRTLTELEEKLGEQVRSVVVSLSGSHIQGHDSQGVVGIRGKEITRGDVERVMDAAKAVPIPPDRELLHVLPQEFLVDGQRSIRDPHGMSGVRLEARVHMITGSVVCAQNIVKCANRAGLAVQDIVFSGLVSAESALSAEEKDLGVCIIDIGAGTTSICVYQSSALVYTAVLPIGGNHVTNDIANTLRTPVHAAEHMKISHGRALADLVPDSDPIEVASNGDRPNRLVSRHLLAEIIQARYEELFDLIHQNLIKHGCHEKLGAGIVLVGGSAKLLGIERLAEKKFSLPSRVKAIQANASGDAVHLASSPEYANILGLLQFCARTPTPYQLPLGGRSVGAALRRTANWLREYF